MPRAADRVPRDAALQSQRIHAQADAFSQFLTPTWQPLADALRVVVGFLFVRRLVHLWLPLFLANGFNSWALPEPQGHSTASTKPGTPPANLTIFKPVGVMTRV